VWVRIKPTKKVNVTIIFIGESLRFYTWHFINYIIGMQGKNMDDESHLPVSEQSLVYRLRKRAEIRRNISDRKSVQENQPDRIADLLEEAANEIDRLKEFEWMYKDLQR